MAKQLVVFALLLLFGSVSYAQTTNQMQYKGINIAGAEFNGNRQNAKHFKDYIWPTNKNLKAMKEFGFNTIRVPFAWERMQPMLQSPLNNDEAKELDRVVQTAHQLGLYVVIDPHNYGKYRGKVLTARAVDLKIFADFWNRLATRYGSYPNVIFGLMNEPHKQSAKDWAQLAQAGLTAIRKTGAEQLILVPGSHWTGVHSWLNGGKNSNAHALLNLQDPLDNFAYEMHQYFDNDSSGTHNKINQKCISTDMVIKKFKRTTDWLESHNKKAFLGEFGVQENSSCRAALEVSLNYIKNYPNLWIGWAYWATGDWMDKYPYNFLNKWGGKGTRQLIITNYLSNN